MPEATSLNCADKIVCDVDMAQIFSRESKDYRSNFSQTILVAKYQMMFFKQHFIDETFCYAFANILHLNKCMDGTKNSSDMIRPLFKPLCNPKI